MTIFFIRAFRETKEQARRRAEQKARPVSTSQRRERVDNGSVMEWAGGDISDFFSFPVFWYIFIGINISSGGSGHPSITHILPPHDYIIKLKSAFNSISPQFPFEIHDPLDAPSFPS